MGKSPKLAIARWLVEQHRLFLFPMRFVDGRKVPAIKGWPEKATQDIAQLEKWFGPGEFNIAVATGASGLIVIDTDQKGVDGDANLRALAGAHVADLDSTFTVESPTGSRHYYFRGDLVRNSVGLLAPAVDIRSRGGYVVAPGSVSDKGAYRVIRNLPIASIPQWLVDLIAQAYTKAAEKVELTAAVELDTDTIQASALQYLSTAAPAIEGEGGNDRTYKVACRLRELGVSEDVALDLLDIYSDWNARCVPPWDRDELAEGPIRNAYNYGQNSPGSAAIDLEFDEIPDDVVIGPDEPEEKPANRFAAAAISIGDECEVMSDPLIDGLFDRGTLVLVTGPQKTGKTFNVLDICAHIATGRAWCDRDVAKGVTIHFLGEGGGGVRRRLKALRQVKDIPIDAPMYVVPVAVDLFKSVADTKGIIEYAKALAGQHGLPVQAIVFDTLARTMAGGDENTVKDMNVVVRHVDRIRAATGAAVFVVTHTGWGDKSRSRGSTALPGAIDGELLLGDGQIMFQNFREYEEPEPIFYSLKSVDLGTDAKGKPVKSAIVEYGGAPAKSKRTSIPDSAQGALDILNDLGGISVLRKDWKEACCKDVSKVSGADDMKSRQTAFRRALEVLLRAELIEIIGNRVSATAAAADLAAPFPDEPIET
jgi:hypothetical protein